MSDMTSQITGFSVVCSAVGSNADQRNYQSSASLAFVRGIHRLPVNSSHKGPVTRKMFPFDDVILVQMNEYMMELFYINITIQMPCMVEMYSCQRFWYSLHSCDDYTDKTWRLFCVSVNLSKSLWGVKAFIFADDVVKLIFFDKNINILFKNSPKFVPNGPIDNKPSLFSKSLGANRPLSEQMRAKSTDAYMRNSASARSWFSFISLITRLWHISPYTWYHISYR